MNEDFAPVAMDPMDPASVIRRLAEIEGSLALKQGFFESAADDLARSRRDWDRRMAGALVAADGSSKEIRESNALLAILATEDGLKLYERLTDAEARHNAVKAAVNSLSARASIGQSILRSLTNEAQRSAMQPAWSAA